MVDFFEAWDAKRARPQPANPAPPARAAIVAGATPYAAAALAGEVAKIQAVPIGSGRNQQLNDSGLAMYRLAAAGQIDEHLITETLGAADGGLDYPATRRTLQSARDAAFTKYGARTIPEPAHTTPAPKVDPSCAQSDDPFADHFAAPPFTPPSKTGSTSAPDGTASNADTTNPSTSTTPPADARPGSAPDAAATSTDPDPYTQLVRVEAARVRLQRDARRLIDQEDAEKLFRVPPYLPTLTDELLLPDEPVTYRVDQLIPTGGNVLLAAQFKAGKTTLISNLARALVDGAPFLDKFGIDRLAGRVAIFNYEVDRAQYRRWLRDLNIGDTNRVAVLPLRGYRLPLLVPHVEDWTVEYLKSVEAEVWIVDPFARAASGSVTNENDNTEVGAFLEALDVIKERAGVSELILPTHTGRAEHEVGDERARGATRLDDWADVRWLLTKDKAGTRYFRATGRDVDTDEAALGFDEATRQLTLTGGDRKTNSERRVDDAVLAVVRGKAGQKAGDVAVGVRQIVGALDNNALSASIARLCLAGQIHVTGASPKLHWPGPAPGYTPPDPFD